MNRVFKALADPTRRKVLELLRQRPMTAGELCEHFPVSKPTMSAHFSVLREADLAREVGAVPQVLWRVARGLAARGAPYFPIWPRISPPGLAALCTLT